MLNGNCKEIDIGMSVIQLEPIYRFGNNNSFTKIGKRCMLNCTVVLNGSGYKNNIYEIGNITNTKLFPTVSVVKIIPMSSVDNVVYTPILAYVSSAGEIKIVSSVDFENTYFRLVFEWNCLSYGL